MNAHGYLWAFMGTYGYLIPYGYLWALMGTYGHLWAFDTRCP